MEHFRAPKARYDAVICDIDGCLGPESSRPLDAPALARIAAHNRRAIDAGDVPLLTVCSGRPQPFAEAMCRFLANDRVPCVAENGVWVYDPRDNRYLLDPAILPEHLDAVAHVQAFVRSTYGPRGVIIQPGKTASVSLWHPDTPYLFSLIAPLRERIAVEGWPFRVSHTVAWINIDLAHVSKATGIDRLLRESGLEPARLAGIGDSGSDRAIAERVAFFAAPANAHEELRPHAHYISPHEEIEGVLDILDRLADAPASP